MGPRKTVQGRGCLRSRLLPAGETYQRVRVLQGPPPRESRSPCAGLCRQVPPGPLHRQALHVRRAAERRGPRGLQRHGAQRQALCRRDRAVRAHQLVRPRSPRNGRRGPGGLPRRACPPALRPPSGAHPPRQAAHPGPCRGAHPGPARRASRLRSQSVSRPPQCRHPLWHHRYH